MRDGQPSDIRVEERSLAIQRRLSQAESGYEGSQGSQALEGLSKKLIIDTEHFQHAENGPSTCFINTIFPLKNSGSPSTTGVTSADATCSLLPCLENQLSIDVSSHNTEKITTALNTQYTLVRNLQPIS